MELRGGVVIQSLTFSGKLFEAFAQFIFDMSDLVWSDVIGHEIEGEKESGGGFLNRITVNFHSENHFFNANLINFPILSRSGGCIVTDRPGEGCRIQKVALVRFSSLIFENFSNLWSVLDSIQTPIQKLLP
jgi:hypothetical protein